MTSGVYRIRNLVKRGQHHSAALQRAWDRYGATNFAFELVEECLPEDCLRREQHYLYTVLFARHSKDSIQKNRIAHAKLQPQDILEVKRLLTLGLTQIEIADRFNISQSTVSLIKNEKIWPLTGVSGGGFVCGIITKEQQ